MSCLFFCQGEKSRRITAGFKQGPHIVRRGEPLPPHGVLDFYHHHAQSFHSEGHERHSQQSMFNANVTSIYDLHMSYAGATTHNYVKVTEAIQLTALFFYGPWTAEISHDTVYEAYISIWEGTRPEDDAVKVEEFKAYPIGRVGELMVVEIPRQLFLRPNRWYTIKFLLNGPPTARMFEEPRTHATVHVEGFGSVKFDFLTGSRQMPEIEFCVVPPSEMKRAEAQWRVHDVRGSMQPRINCCHYAYDWLSSFFI